MTETVTERDSASLSTQTFEDALTGTQTFAAVSRAGRRVDRGAALEYELARAGPFAGWPTRSSYAARCATPCAAPSAASRWRRRRKPGSDSLAGRRQSGVRTSRRYSCSYSKPPSSAREPWAGKSPRSSRRRHTGGPEGRQAGVRGRRPREGQAGHPGSARGTRGQGEDHPGGTPTASSRRSSAGSPDTLDYDGFGDVDFVIEAVPERMDIKQSVFAELDAVTPGHAILASNTSALSITEMAEATTAPRQGRGLPLLLPGVDDAPDRGDRGRGDLRGDAPDRRQLRPVDPQDGGPLRRGARASWSTGSSTRPRPRSGGSPTRRASTIEEVDKVIKESGTTPMGPYFLTDLLGLDTVLHVAEHLRESYGDRFYVSPKMKELVAAGNLGQKTGKGFYEHGN